jgi:hypothetical protein
MVLVEAMLILTKYLKAVEVRNTAQIAKLSTNITVAFMTAIRMVET